RAGPATLLGCWWSASGGWARASSRTRPGTGATGTGPTAGGCGRRSSIARPSGSGSCCARGAPNRSRCASWTCATWTCSSRTCTPELLLGGTNEALARMIHEEYVRQQQKLGQTTETNPSMVPWDELPEGLKESNRRQADDIGRKLREVGYCHTPTLDWGVPL